MDKKTERRLREAGWNIGDAADFLELTAEEVAFIEMKLAMSRSLRQEREKQEITQVALAKLLGSSQSRVAKMEAGDSSVTIDLLMRALLALGLTKKDLSKIVAKADQIAASV
jgi:plasmid maintenance system antidote protein VapI